MAVDYTVALELDSLLAVSIREGSAVRHEQLAHVRVPVERRKIESREAAHVGDERVGLVVNHDTRAFHLVAFRGIQELLRGAKTGSQRVRQRVNKLCTHKEQRRRTLSLIRYWYSSCVL